MRPHVNDLRGNSSSYLPPTVLFVPPRREDEKAIFERTCSSLEVNKFISDKLQPDEIFHCLFNDAMDSLYRELQRDLQNTNYGIHNLIKVSTDEENFKHPQGVESVAKDHKSRTKERRDEAQGKVFLVFR